MDQREDCHGLNNMLQSSEVAVLVASGEDGNNCVEIGPTSSGKRGGNIAPNGDNISGREQICSGKFPKSSPFSCKVFLLKRLPIIKWLPKYQIKRDLLPDIMSGVTVGLTAVPQGIAYANVAGLTPEYGLYSSFISCFVYLLLGSCRQMVIGPTALVELLVFEECGEDFASCVILVGFWVGVIQFLMGLLKLGAVVSLISDPVTIGFVAGSSLTISSSQIKSFLGLSGEKGSGFIGVLEASIKNIKTAKVGDSCLGIGCVILLLLFKNLKDYVKPSTRTTTGKVISKVVWFLAMGRNAIVVVAASIIAASLTNPPFALTGNVKSGFPPVRPPDFLLPASRFPEYNETSGNGTLTFWETWDELRTAPLMIAVISILQNVAIAKAFGSGQSIDATQEMIALGVAHIVSSFFSAMPTAGSFTRSAVNEASGVRSCIGGIFTGILVMFALSFLTRWFAYIPKASLAAVILCAVLPMIEYESIIPMWKVSKTDVLTALITFLASVLLGMEYGIVIGVGVSLIFYLVRPVRPQISWSIEKVKRRKLATKGKEEQEENCGRKRLLNSDDNETVNVGDDDIARFPGDDGTAEEEKQFILVCPEQGFMFPCVDAIRSLINKLALRNPSVKLIILDCRHMINMDYTAAGALASLVKALKKTGKDLVFLNCKEEWGGMMSIVGLKEPKRYDGIEDIDL